MHWSERSLGGIVWIALRPRELRFDLIQPICEVIAWLVTIPANNCGLLAALPKQHMGGAVSMGSRLGDFFDPRSLATGFSPRLGAQRGQHASCSLMLGGNSLDVNPDMLQVVSIDRRSCGTRMAG